MRIALLLAVLIVVALALFISSPTKTADLQGLASSRAPQTTSVGEHEDHEPRHGGIFFMAMNNHHHLEGVLEAPGIFRVYVYDSYTKPLSLHQMKQVSGKVLLGESESAPEIPLTLSRDGETLEAVLDRRTKLPVTLTLLLRFPGMVRDARPELFTFPFREFSKPATAPGPVP